jgi:hypothetical protein
LLLGDKSKALIVDKEFYFGLVYSLSIGLIHEKLEEELNIPMMTCYVPRSSWSKVIN